MRIAVCLLLVTAATAAQVPAPAADPLTAGPQVGQPVPGFQLSDQNGRLTSLDTVRGRRGAMVVFYRSASW